MNRKIAIIGSGISGLSLGYFLLKKNFDVTIFEQDMECGGLLGSVEIQKEISVEKFYHHVFPFDKDFINLFSELGLNDLKWHNSSNSIFFENQYLNFSGIKDYVRFPYLNIFEKARLLLGGYIFSKKSLSRIESLTAEKAIKKYMGEASWNKIWGPLFDKKFGTQASNIQAAWFWWRMNVKLGSKGREVLGYPETGFKDFINILVNSIERLAGHIVLNKKIESINKKGNKFIVDNSVFDKVVFTIPSKEINKIYKKAVLKEVEYRAAINLILVVKKPLTKWYWNNILDKEVPFVGIIEHTNLVGVGKYSNKSIIYLTQYLDKNDSLFNKTADEIYNEYRKYFKKADIIEEEVVSFFVNKSKYAQPLIKVVPKKIGFEKIEENAFSISMENIYPEDRGINQAIKYARELSDKIS